MLLNCLLCCYWIYPSCVSSRLGSWAGPAWFKMLLGLGGNQGGGGRKGVISCSSNITFHSIHRKTFLIYSSILTFRYASFGCDAIGKIYPRWLDCYFINFERQIYVNISKNRTNLKTYTYFLRNTHFLFLDAFFAEKKPPEGTATHSKRGWAPGALGPN